MKRLMILFLLIMLLISCGSMAETYGGQDVTLFAANVGKGDALIVRVDDYACLIDAGKTYARGKVLTALEYMGVDRLNAVFLTHTDDDHGEGLEWLAESDIPVDAWYASAMFTEVKENKHDAVQAAKERGRKVVWLQRGDQVPLGNTGAVFNVLGPSVLNQDKDDNNSLIMMLETAQGRMLLTGDMELEQEAVLLSKNDDLSCAVLKVPNHADNDTTSDRLTRAASAQVAVISTDSYEKPGTPDPGVLRRLQAAGTACHVTQDAELGIKVVLTGGQANVTMISAAEPVNRDVVLSEVVPGDDIIVLRNNGAAVSLSGWYLYSDKGEELFAFPDGAVIDAGASLIIGTKTSESERFDFLWDEKKVIHQSKADAIVLYDGYGRRVDAMGNGF